MCDFQGNIDVKLNFDENIFQDNDILASLSPRRTIQAATINNVARGLARVECGDRDSCPKSFVMPFSV